MVEHLSALFTFGNMQFLLRGVIMTLLLTVVGCTVGLIGGFLLAYTRTSKGTMAAPLRWGATVFVEIFRRIPFLVTLFLVLYTAQMVVPEETFRGSFDS